MHSHALPMDPILRPADWLPDWFRDWAIGLLKQRIERRAAPRRMVANLKAHYWEGTGAASHVVRDVSLSGAFIYADFKWVPGTIVTMTLQRQDQVADSDSPQSVVVRAKVVREGQDGLGLQFLYFDKRERKSLTEFLQSIPTAGPS